MSYFSTLHLVLPPHIFLNRIFLVEKPATKCFSSVRFAEKSIESQSVR